jgi:hypothetical protein
MRKYLMSIIHKICKGCLIDKPISEFNKNSQFGKGINSKCKACVNNAANAYYDKFPWRKTFYVIKDRCTRKKNSHYKNYGERGIKCLITSEEIKKLWFRDKAYLMKHPTIDRIDNDGNYTLENCQWLENEENIRKSHPIVNVGQFDLNGNLIKIWNSQHEASKTLNYSQASLSRSINHNRIAYGYKWRKLNAKS